MNNDTTHYGFEFIVKQDENRVRVDIVRWLDGNTYHVERSIYLTNQEALDLARELTELTRHDLSLR